MDIVSRLEALNLPVPHQTELTDETEYTQFVGKIRQFQYNLDFPTRYQPADSTCLSTRRFLESLGVVSMWQQDSFVQAAADIITEPVLKRHIEVLILGPLNFVAIANRMRRHFNLDSRSMNPRVVQAYAHYFWNYDALDKQSWETLIHSWIEGRNNDYLVSLNAPRTKYGAALSAWMAEGGVTPLKDTHAIRAMRDESFRHFMQVTTMYNPGVKSSEAMRNLFTVFLQAQEAIEMRQGGTAEVLEELRRIEADYDTSTMRTVHELPSASISVIDAHAEEVTEE